MRTSLAAAAVHGRGRTPHPDVAAREDPELSDASVCERRRVEDAMEPGASELRRSARERRATTVKYNGFAVRTAPAICQGRGRPDPQERQHNRCFPSTERDVQYVRTASYTLS
jgi:hypothetical protein